MEIEPTTSRFYRHTLWPCATTGLKYIIKIYINEYIKAYIVYFYKKYIILRKLMMLFVMKYIIKIRQKELIIWHCVTSIIIPNKYIIGTIIYPLRDGEISLMISFAAYIN